MTPQVRAILWMGVAALALAALFGAAALLARSSVMKPEWSRKMIHVGVGLIAVSFGWLFEQTWPVAVLSTLGLGLVLLSRLWAPLRGSVGVALHGVERRSLGDVCLPIVVPVLHALAMPDRALYAIPLLILALGDAAAALVGVWRGRRRYRTDEGVKSMEGSIAMALVSALVVAVGLAAAEHPPVRCLAVAAMVAILVTIMEAISWRGLDNLILPLASYALLLMYVPMPLERVVGWIGLSLLIVTFALLAYRRAGLMGAAGLGGALILYASWALGGWAWLLAPLFMALTVCVIGGRQPFGRGEVYGPGVLLCLAAAPLTWLFLARAFEEASLFLPFLAGWTGALGVIGATRQRVEQRVAASSAQRDWSLAIRVLLGAAAAGVACWSVPGPGRSAGAGYVLGAALCGAAAGWLLTIISPVEAVRPSREVRWLARSAVVAIASTTGLALRAIALYSAP
jgi:phytol kinase